MSKRQDLAAQIKQLDDKQMEVLRLKYGDGLNYSQIGQKLSMTTTAVGQVLFGALKKLEADGAASFNEDERAKILGFIHGELDAGELQSMAIRIEAEEGLRKEFESWLAVSDDIERLLAKPSKRPPGLPKPASVKKFWIAAGVVAVVGVALPLLKNSKKTDHAPIEGLEATTHASEAAPAAQPAGSVGSAAPAQLASEMNPAGATPTTDSRPFGSIPEKKSAALATKTKIAKNSNSKRTKSSKPTKKVRAKSSARPKTTSL
jgi:hypothetical protein